LAETPLARVGQTEEIAIVWRPFELRPEGVPPLDPDSEYIRSGWQNSVLPLAHELGVKMVRPPVQPRTRLAHEAAEFARRLGRQAEMAEGLFRAFFQDGRDIGQVTVLCDIGLAAGVDPVELRRCLEERTLQAEVEEELQMAGRYQITAVPTFIVGNRFMLRGLVAEEQLQRAIAMCKGEGLINLE
jgi:predicted DsbA family dithiol-disulfide isomerase